MANSIEYGAMDAETVAGLLGVSTRQLSNYIKLKGLPSSGEGRGRTFVWPHVLDWWVGYKVSLDRNLGNDGNDDGEYAGGTSDNGRNSVPELKTSERRRAKAMADLKDIELEERRGRLVPMALVNTTLQDVAKGLQTEILGLPTRITATVVAIRDRDELFSYLTTEAKQLCTRLSQLEIGGPAKPDEDPVDADDE